MIYKSLMTYIFNMIFCVCIMQVYFYFFSLLFLKCKVFFENIM